MEKNKKTRGGCNDEKEQMYGNVTGGGNDGITYGRMLRQDG